MTFEEMFAKAKELIMKNDVSAIPGHLAVQINITGEGSGVFYIELLEGKLYVEPYEYYDHDCIFILSAKNFFKLADGSLNPVAAFTLGKLKVEGSIEKALEFQNIVNQL